MLVARWKLKKRNHRIHFVSIEFETLSSGVAPYIETTRAINSKIVWSNDPTQGNNTENSTQENSELKPMLCFTAHRTSRFDSGTIYAYLDTRERIWDYSLAYNGPDGLYEKFGVNMMICSVTRCVLLQRKCFCLILINLIYQPMKK